MRSDALPCAATIWDEGLARHWMKGVMKLARHDQPATRPCPRAAGMPAHVPLPPQHDVAARLPTARRPDRDPTLIQPRPPQRWRPSVSMRSGR